MRNGKRLEMQGERGESVGLIPEEIIKLLPMLYLTLSLPFSYTHTQIHNKYMNLIVDNCLIGERETQCWTDMWTGVTDCQNINSPGIVN